MRYISHRLAHAALLLIGASVLTFVFTTLAPGNYFEEMRLNPQVSPQTVAALKAHYDLDKPLPERYWAWLKSLAHGDMGYSFAYNSPVSPLLAVRARNTLLLTITATLLSWLIALPLGVLAEWGLRVGQELGLDEKTLQSLEVAALLHDIGKVGIPDAILRKPTKLDPEEYALIKKHPEYGWVVLRGLPGFESAALDILHHHESVDGSGYPAGLRNSEIPIVSRIVCVIDAYDAMVSSRPYRKGLPFEEAARRLTACSGTQFDSLVVQSFLPIAEAEMNTVFAAAGTA